MFSTKKDSALIQSGLDELLREARTSPKKLQQLQKALRAPKRFSTALGEALASAAVRTAPPLFKSLKRSGPAMLRERHAIFGGFERRLYRTWKRPLDLLEMMIVACAEAGEELSKEWPWNESTDDSLVFEVVRRLQARSCQVAYEILTLLKTGYAPAAHARWRTLHETAATVSFITKHGPDVAERFYMHEHVDAWRAAEYYQRYCHKLGYSRYSRKEMAEFRRNYRAVLKQYGPDFRHSYGWASDALTRKDPKKRNPGFADIEKDVSLDHLRPYYKMASYPVHATVKAIRFSLALEPGKDLLLTGPSNLGLSDPGHSTAISLGQTTIAMLMLRPSTDSLSLMHVLLSFTDEIGDAFLEAHRKLMAKGKRRRR